MNEEFLLFILFVLFLIFIKVSIVFFRFMKRVWGILFPKNHYSGGPLWD